MSKGIIYVMTTVVPGLIKIGKTATDNFKQRMYQLESNGYKNVTVLKRAFAIEVNNYDDKEKLLHTIFEKSQVADTELFAVDINLVISLLSSFEGNIIYPEQENKEDIFKEASETTKSNFIPDGYYFFKRVKKTENNKIISAQAKIENGNWTLLKGSFVGVVEEYISTKAKEIRDRLPLDKNNKLLEDVELGTCSPSFAGIVVFANTCDGWYYWRNNKGEQIDIYRKNN